MTKFWTWTEIRSKVEKDLAIEDEDFIPATELLAYANEAIHEAESEIHCIYEDYFLSNAQITLASGTDSYSFPTDIYAHKIRDIVYKNGATIQSIPRLRDWRKFDVYSLNSLNSSNQGAYQYFIVNKTAGSPQIVFTPPVQESGPYVTVWYLRTANRLAVDTDICDIPEFVNFVMQYMKVRCYEKEGHPNLPKAVSDLEQQREQMNATLTGMVPDNENQIEPDLTHYEDMA